MVAVFTALMVIAQGFIIMDLQGSGNLTPQ